MTCEGGGFSVEKPPPLRSLSKRLTLGRFEGEKLLLSEKCLSPRISPKRAYLPSSLQMRLYSASSRR